MAALEDGLSARNRLIHRILIDNIDRFVDREERRKVVAMIMDLRSKVQKASKAIDPFVKSLSLTFHSEVGEQAEAAFSRFLAQHADKQPSTAS